VLLMMYLRSFRFASEGDELEYKFSSEKLSMTCYDMTNAYPFDVLTHKLEGTVEFEPITIFYGGNGSGKSTALNIIAEKMKLRRTAPFNNTPLMEDYLAYCQYELASEPRRFIRNSEIITSDGVFDLLLEVRAINEGVDRDREALFEEYASLKDDLRDNGWQMKSLSDYDELKRRNEIRRKSKTNYVTARMRAKETRTGSNGESAYQYFTDRIRSDALYLLDEPENSLSAKLQAELAVFLLESVRFYRCQLIISTHSPFLLAMKGAKIYDLDSSPAAVRDWSELPNVRAYYELFKNNASRFE